MTKFSDKKKQRPLFLMRNHFEDLNFIFSIALSSSGDLFEKIHPYTKITYR